MSDVGLVDVRIGDLTPLDTPAHAAVRPQLRALTDDELLKSVRQPDALDYVVVNTRTGKLHDSNGRVLELQRRASGTSSLIDNDRTIPVKYYTPDLSMFLDLP